MIYALIKNTLGGMLYLFAIPYLGWYVGSANKSVSAPVSYAASIAWTIIVIRIWYLEFLRPLKD